jgi:gamma-glutamylcyclotransferase (GGCT)/AIG2-like uncharacterized protein YtfP
MPNKCFNLFVYGSLRDSIIFESVSGFSFTTTKEESSDAKLFAEPAFLDKYRKVSPDNIYYYAMPYEPGRIEGFVIYNIPRRAIAEIDRYEGKRYKKETVRVNTANNFVEALAYLAKPEKMEEDFGDRWHVNLIEELWLRKRIEQFIEAKTRPGDHTEDANLERLAERELLGTTERDLVISQYRHTPFSDFYIEQELAKPRPSIRHLYNDEKAIPYINNYLGIVIKNGILSRFEELIRSKYRFQLEHLNTSKRYFDHSFSILAALRMINSDEKAVNMLIQQGIEKIDYKSHDLIDYIKYAIKAANEIFDTRLAKNQLDFIASNIRTGLTPLGAEVELSNLGYKTISSLGSPAGIKDDIYDSFYYFYDFHLDILTWRLGGCVDNHSGSTEKSRRRGFLEMAPGRLNIAGELSMAATADPWTLNQLINQITKFFDVKPHSLHLSFQMRKNQIGKQKLLPVGFVKCLLALGGGLEQNPAGKMWLSRLGQAEIISKRDSEGLAFSLTGKRKWYLGDNELGGRVPSHAINQVYQYKFIRLDVRANYEPLILCLKGIQIAYNPADYITAEQLRESPELMDELIQLKEWAANPKPISPKTINKFIETVRLGLMTESRGKAVHKLHYIEWAINSTNVQLRLFNKILSNHKG